MGQLEIISNIRTPSIAYKQEIVRFEVEDRGMVGLTSSQKEIVLAAKPSEDNLVVSETDNRPFLVELTSKALTRLGQKMTAVEIVALATLLVEDLEKEEFKLMTQNEVKKAVNNYIDRLYSKDDEVLFLSSATFVRALRGYKNQTKIEAFKIYNLNLQKSFEKPEPSLAEQRRQFIEVVNGHAEKWRTEGNSEPDYQLPIDTSMPYQLLKHYNIWQMPLEQAKKWYEDIKEQYPNKTETFWKTEASIAAYKYFVFTFLVEKGQELAFEN